MIEIDHVIVLVPDLDRAGDEFLDRFGLSSVPGGRHAGHGTGNRVVPLGPDYLELMAVVDSAEAAESPLGRWAAAHTTTDLTPAALCLRTDDIGSISAVLGEEPEAMSRRLPDGSVLSWHLAGLSGMLGPDNLPFFIEWHCDPADHPGATQVDHRIATSGITGVQIGSPGSLEPILTAIDGVTIADGVGVIATTIGSADGPITLG
ncbi:MAG: VOC family protein [Acidimicrobiia bacterium]